jgi:pyruvate/2-oxoglutarate/acetoin dehydrogenase E1 component
VPLGVPEILSTGDDITVVTYGPNVRYVQQAMERIKDMPFSVELIDVQTLLPFDMEHVIGESLKKTNRLLVIDEDVPGGSCAFIMQKILEEQNAYYHLDAKPRTLSSKEHRTPFGSDGDYFTKPQVGDIVDAILEVIAE